MIDVTAIEWSPAERFVSGAAPSAISPSVDKQSVPRFMPFGLRQSSGSSLQKTMHTALDYVGSPCSWDNAVCERFFLNLKMERVWQGQYANHGEAQRDIADYIVNFYNAQRLHSTLGYVPPNEFEQLHTTTFPQTH